MGTWGAGIFSDDVASDARETYREFLGDGLDDSDALASLITEMTLLDGGQLSGNTRIAIALTLHRFGRLTNEVRDDALALIDAGPEAHWDTAALVRSRTAALARARKTLVSDQPARKRVPKPWRPSTTLTPGNVLGLRHAGVVTLLRVARVDATRTGDHVVVATLDYAGEAVPSTIELESIADVPVGTQPRRAPDAGGESAPGRLQVITRNHKFEVDYQAAGFEIVGSMAPRDGDHMAQISDYYVWEWAAKLIANGEWFAVSEDNEFWFLDDE